MLFRLEATRRAFRYLRYAVPGQCRSLEEHLLPVIEAHFHLISNEFLSGAGLYRIALSLALLTVNT